MIDRIFSPLNSLVLTHNAWLLHHSWDSIVYVVDCCNVFGGYGHISGGGHIGVLIGQRTGVSQLSAAECNVRKGKYRQIAGSTDTFSP